MCHMHNQHNINLSLFIKFVNYIDTDSIKPRATTNN